MAITGANTILGGALQGGANSVARNQEQELKKQLLDLQTAALKQKVDAAGRVDSARQALADAQAARSDPRTASQQAGTSTVPIPFQGAGLPTGTKGGLTSAMADLDLAQQLEIFKGDPAKLQAFQKEAANGNGLQEIMNIMQNGLGQGVANTVGAQQQQQQQQASIDFTDPNSLPQFNVNAAATALSPKQVNNGFRPLEEGETFSIDSDGKVKFTQKGIAKTDLAKNVELIRNLQGEELKLAKELEGIDKNTKAHAQKDNELTNVRIRKEKALATKAEKENLKLDAEEKETKANFRSAVTNGIDDSGKMFTMLRKLESSDFLTRPGAGGSTRASFAAQLAVLNPNSPQAKAASVANDFSTLATSNGIDDMLKQFSKAEQQLNVNQFDVILGTKPSLDNFPAANYRILGDKLRAASQLIENSSDPLLQDEGRAKELMRQANRYYDRANKIQGLEEGGGEQVEEFEGQGLLPTELQDEYEALRLQLKPKKT